MIKFFTPIKSIGLEFNSTAMQGAEIEWRHGKAEIIRLFGCSLEVLPDHVKQLYIDQPFITTALEGPEVLVRPLSVPLIKEKDVDAALAFQAEPILPYPVEEALLVKQTLRQTQEGTDLTLLSTRKSLLQSHLDQCHLLDIEPEKVSCIQAALCQFTRHYFDSEKAYIVFHVQEGSTSCVLIDEGKLIASITHSEGLTTLIQAYQEDADRKASYPLFDQIDFANVSATATPKLGAALSKLQKTAAMKGLALIKELHGKSLEGVIVTGEVANLTHLDQAMTTLLKQPLMRCTSPTPTLTSADLHSHAVPLGLALGSLPQAVDPIDFRQQELSYPHPWNRLKIPLAIYFCAILGLSAAFYIFGQNYIAKQEDLIKQEYVNLLANMNKTYDQFETTYLTKNHPAAIKDGEIQPITALTQEELLERLMYLQKDLRETPDSFPLFANIPRVSDLIAWMNQHPTVTEVNQDGSIVPRLQVENLSYTLVKRPLQGKKTDKYQVKVELEFTSPTPKWAREFHDALIAPNDWVDPKGEIKWSSNRGKYKTSFFLKDKTHYPGQ